MIWDGQMNICTYNVHKYLVDRQIKIDTWLHKHYNWIDIYVDRQIRKDNNKDNQIDGQTDR